MVKVIWTDTAIQDLVDIGNHIAKDSERYAEVTVERLFNSADILENFPKAGKMIPEFENELIRELIRGSYRIVYHVIDDFRIDIITVHNCARLLGNTYDFSEIENE
jgi:plasmid stabilization system protein ParE